MATASAPHVTVEQYLEQELQAEFRSEYFRGEIFAMSGNKLPHALLVTNLSGELRDALRRRDCKVVTNEIRLGIPQVELYAYPDLMVICGPAEMRDDTSDTVLNPALIVEVLSRSTEAYDRGRKFEMYRTIASLREYIMVAQDRVFVEQYLRQPSGDWLLREHTAVSGNPQLSINVELNLAAVYERVLPEAK